MIDGQRRVADLDADREIYHTNINGDDRRAHLDDGCKKLRTAVSGPKPAHCWFQDALVCVWCDPEVTYSVNDNRNGVDRSVLDALSDPEVTTLEEAAASLKKARAAEEAGG